MQNALLFRSLLIIAILIIELLFITIQFDAFKLARNDQWWAGLLAHSRDILRGLSAFVVAFLLLASGRLSSWYHFLADLSLPHPWLRWLGVHIMLFGLFSYTSLKLFTPATANSTWFLLWSGLGFLLLASWLLSLAPGHFWRSFLQKEKTTLVIAVAIGISAWALSQLTQEFWEPLASATFWLSQHMLDLFYIDIVSNTSGSILGTPDFQVRIAPVCSGYEGIGLIVVFVSVYLWLFRKSLRFPHALLLLPVGILVIWLANAVRITSLIAIGSSISEDIAVGGFHSQAGWIFFLCVSLGVMWAGHRYFSQAENSNSLAAVSGSSPSISEAAALLAPMMTLLAAMILTSAAMAEFDWLYPVKVIMTAIALAWFWQHYKNYDWQISWQSVAIGVGVFIVWIVIAPIGQDTSSDLYSQLQQQSSLAVGVWIFFRIIGSTITVPLAEELAFRGYLVRKLISPDFEKVRFGQLTWPSLIISSVAFGVMHGSWLAGTLAGMAYAYAVYRRGKITDAIYAHITTNALIAAYVLLFDQWWLW